MTARGWVGAAMFGLAAGVGVLRRFPPGPASLYPPCVWKSYTGLECPGCGGTRALAALVQGDWAAAWGWNPLSTVLVPVLLVYGVWQGWQAMVHGRFRSHGVPTPAGAVLAISTVALTVWRNL